MGFDLKKKTVETARFRILEAATNAIYAREAKLERGKVLENSCDAFSLVNWVIPYAEFF